MKFNRNKLERLGRELAEGILQAIALSNSTDLVHRTMFKRTGLLVSFSVRH